MGEDVAVESAACSAIWIAVIIVAAGCEAGAPVASLRRPIVAGTKDTGDPAIMELLSNQGGALWARCTATLVTPRVLLTAAHCFVETPGSKRWIFPGNDDTQFTAKDLLPLAATAYDPAYKAPRQGHDLAVVVLASPLPIVPVRINRTSLGQAQGKSVRYVGYGLTNGNDPNTGGIKRAETAPIAQLSGPLVAVAAGAHGSCQGDSGGPMLLDDGQGESIVGIASFIDNPRCTGDSFYQRLDTQLGWLDGELAK